LHVALGSHSLCDTCASMDMSTRHTRPRFPVAATIGRAFAISLVWSKAGQQEAILNAAAAATGVTDGRFSRVRSLGPVSGALDQIPRSRAFAVSRRLEIILVYTCPWIPRATAGHTCDLNQSARYQSMRGTQARHR